MSARHGKWARTESGCHRAVLLELVDTALDSMTLLVVLGVELRRTSTGRPLPRPVGSLIGLDRNGRADTAFTQVGAISGAAVCLVGQHTI